MQKAIRAIKETADKGELQDEGFVYSIEEHSARITGILNAVKNPQQTGSIKAILKTMQKAVKAVEETANKGELQDEGFVHSIKEHSARITSILNAVKNPQQTALSASPSTADLYN